MDRVTKIYLLSLLLLGGGIFLVIHYGNALYLDTGFIPEPVSVGNFWDNLQSIFLPNSFFIL